jgi:hypothetical protein
MVIRLLSQKKHHDQNAARCKQLGDNLDFRGGGSDKIQEYWGMAAMHMHMSIAVAEYITKNAKPNYHTVTGEDVGKPSVKIGGAVYRVQDSIGRIMVQDIGRKLYVINNLLYMGPHD